MKKCRQILDERININVRPETGKYVGKSIQNILQKSAWACIAEQSVESSIIYYQQKFWLSKGRRLKEKR